MTFMVQMGAQDNAKAADNMTGRMNWPDLFSGLFTPGPPPSPTPDFGLMGVQSTLTAQPSIPNKIKIEAFG